MMSPEANKIKFFMVKHLSTFSHCFRETIEGAYEAAINNYGYAIPAESKDEIVSDVIEAMRAL